MHNKDPLRRTTQLLWLYVAVKQGTLTHLLGGQQMSSMYASLVVFSVSFANGAADLTFKYTYELPWQLKCYSETH